MNSFWQIKQNLIKTHLNYFVIRHTWTEYKLGLKETYRYYPSPPPFKKNKIGKLREFVQLIKIPCLEISLQYFCGFWNKSRDPWTIPLLPKHWVMRPMGLRTVGLNFHTVGTICSTVTLWIAAVNLSRFIHIHGYLCVAVVSFPFFSQRLDCVSLLFFPETLYLQSY